jgi:hypothetical protein
VAAQKGILDDVAGFEMAAQDGVHSPAYPLGQAVAALGEHAADLFSFRRPHGKLLDPDGQRPFSARWNDAFSVLTEMVGGSVTA